MSNNVRFSRGLVSRVIGISALIAILIVAGCSTNAKFAVTTTSASIPAGSVSAGAVYPSTTLAASNGTAPYSWSVTSGALPVGLKLSSGGVISGTPTASGASSFTVTVTDAASPAHTATANLGITINGAVTVSTSGTLTTVGGVGAAYSSTLAQTGGVGPFTWALNSGNLPGGLTLGATGMITGTISQSDASGPYTFTAKITDSQSGTATSGTLTLTVDPAVAITAPAFPSGAAGVNYASPAFGASGGSGTGYTYALASGSIAPLAINANTGIISGKPTAAGTLSFTVKATDSLGFTATSGALTIAINPPISVGISPTGPVSLDQSGTAPITATVNNDPNSAGVTWTITSGAGSLTGATTTTVTYNAPAVVATASTAVITATSVTDPTKAATFSVNLVLPPAITPATLPGGNVGTPYNQSVSVSNGIGPYTWSISSGAQPAGVNFNLGTTSATLSGIPSTAATYSFTVTVKDSGNPQQSASMPYSVVIGAQLPLSITTSSLPGGSLNTVYGPVSVNATGGYAPYSFGATGLPTGLNLSSGGSLTGTPTVAGTGFSVSITVTDSETPTPVTANVTLPLTITTSPLVLSPGTGSLPSATQNAAYTTSLTPSGGAGPYTITLDGSSAALPSPLSFNGTSASAAAATITGTPTATSTTTGIIVDVTDSESPAVTQKFTYSLAVVVPCGSGSESLLSGQYAFTLRGFDASGPVAVGGVFNADGTGKVATLVGIEDVNSNSGSAIPTSLPIDSANSSYNVGSDRRGCLTINTTAGTQFFRFSIGAITSGVASIGHMVEFDATGSNTAGELRLQNPASFSTSAISGNYAFGASGPDVPTGKFAIVGLLNLSGGSVVTTGASPSVIDTNDNGNINNTHGSVYPASPIALSSGGLYNIGANGRGTLSLVVPGGSGSTVNIIVYPISTTEFLVLAGDPQSANGLYIGSAMHQSGGPFSISSLNAKSILYTTGLGNNGGTAISRVSAGILTPSSGNVLFSGQQNNGGSLQAQSATGVTYAVAANGRVTFAGGGGSSPLIYLVSPNKGFAIFVDNSTTNAHVESGFLEPQSGGPTFSAASASGTYAFGAIQPDDANIGDESGIAIFNSTTGNVSGTSDDNSSGNLSPANTFGPFTYSVDSTGLGVIPAGCSIDGTTGQNGTCQTFFYIISPTKAVVVDATSSTTSTDPHLEVADQ